ncbi:SpoIIE family protein phosphatase [Pilimelia anulata]|nr:SpoIIE family protein phosphatase [Pilimelia anulata]
MIPGGGPDPAADEPAGGRVLVVDDSPAKRYVLVNWLLRAGFAVDEAATGGGALAALGRRAVDAVVLDVRLPDMSGFEVCRAIKSDPALASIPVIHVSAHAVDVVDRTHGLNHGADGYLVEPIDPGEFLASVRSVLRYYRARQRAELLADRLGQLARVTLDLNSATGLPALLAGAVRGAAAIFDSTAAVALEGADGSWTASTIAGPRAEPVPAPAPPVTAASVAVGVTVGPLPAGAWPGAAGPDEPLLVATARLRSDRCAARIAVPASVAAAESVLNQLAQALAGAAEAQRSYDQEHRIAITFQRSLLPQRLPRPAGLDLAVRYLPASSDAEVGGDFYELAMIDGQLVVAIGDVTGHSLHAATIMGELRHALRAYAVEGHPPEEVLDRLNDLLCTLLPDESATLCLLTLDPATGAVRLANAGHMPPLLLPAGEPGRYVVHPGTLLGLRTRRPPDLRLTLPPGATLLLYTDGLVERRGAVIDEGLDSLAEVAAAVDGDLDAFCARLLRDMHTADVDDDIAIVALRRHGA